MESEKDWSAGSCLAVLLLVGTSNLFISHRAVCRGQNSKGGPADVIAGRRLEEAPTHEVMGVACFQELLDRRWFTEQPDPSELYTKSPMEPVVNATAVHQTELEQCAYEAMISEQYIKNAPR